MNLELNEFLNVFDIFCLFIIFLSALFSLKSGLLKNLLNLVKWIVLISSIKYSFDYLREPFNNALGLSPTLIDISIFISVFIISYVAMTLINRIIIGLVSSDKHGSIDKLFGVIFGIIRGYIIVVIFFSIVNDWNYSRKLIYTYDGKSVLFESINKGKKLFKLIPEQLEEQLKLN